MTADIAKQRYTSSYDWIGGSDNNANASTRATEWNKWHGGDGDDYLKSSSDTHYNSGNARDIIVGGGGDDTLIGDGGLDRVTDFSVAEGDKLQVNTQTQSETTLSEVGLTIAANSENNAHTDILFEGQTVFQPALFQYASIVQHKKPACFTSAGS